MSIFFVLFYQLCFKLRMSERLLEWFLYYIRRAKMYKYVACNLNEDIPVEKEGG